MGEARAHKASPVPRAGGAIARACGATVVWRATPVAATPVALRHGLDELRLAASLAWLEGARRMRDLQSVEVASAERDSSNAVGLAARDLQQSWLRSANAGVSPSLAAAPLVLREDALVAAREGSDWVGLAESVLTPLLGGVHGSGHVLTLFDRHGRMLCSMGDPFVLEKLDDIHFIPGADWSEEQAGTNGPGTALATGRAVHVVGVEHFVEAWHPWHCAAVPLRGPGDEVVGALDLSGSVDCADPRVLQLARALGGTVEQALQARAFRRQALVLARYAELTARYPGDALVAVDAWGRVLQATVVATARGLPQRLKFPPGVPCLSAPPQQAAWLAGASVHPVLEGSARVGACLLSRESKPVSRRATASADSPVRYRFSHLVGPGLSDAVSLARSAASTQMPVLLLGESGVGKEVFAQSIHAESLRRQGPFVAVNCAAISRDLLESELFGYVGGAFSGARPEGAVGRIEAASTGTLFLDEVGDLPLPAQAALLRVLEARVVTPVGSSATRAVDVRVISATNRNLDEAVAQGRFRLDLLHRLNVIAVEVPALRDRPQDLPLLVEHLSRVVEQETGLSVTLTDEVREALGRHGWPGNVRELQNVLSRLAVLGRERPVTVKDLPFTPAPVAPAGANHQVQRLLEVIHSAKNMAEAAERLGINRSTLYRQLERLGLKPRRTAVP